MGWGARGDRFRERSRGFPLRGGSGGLSGSVRGNCRPVAPRVGGMKQGTGMKEQRATVRLSRLIHVKNNTSELTRPRCRFAPPCPAARPLRLFSASGPLRASAVKALAVERQSNPERLVTRHAPPLVHGPQTRWEAVCPSFSEPTSPVRISTCRQAEPLSSRAERSFGTPPSPCRHRNPPKTVPRW